MFRPLPALVLSLAASATALSSTHGAHLRRHNAVASRTNTYVPRADSYKLFKEYAGQTFFDDWDYFDGSDPTHGLVNFLTGDDASKLAYVQKDGTAVIGVDTSDNVPVGGKRDSIRITSKDSFKRGLFIADIYSMPHGCSVWPAYWSIGAGKDWPLAGEIDIIEGVNDQTQNQITLHSGPGCLLDKATHALSRILGTQCESKDGDNSGCAFQQEGNSTYGHSFNMQAGGVYAHTLEDEGISVWFFDRSAIPADITAKTPDPASWGTPTAFFPNTQCDILGHFLPQQLIFDITICGDWAGPAYAGSGCPGTCEQAVADPKNFAVAQWKIASVRVYQ
ncbi:glycoside hydrolase family 16 protein [Daedaleopsis nitida]|nr:glycoside hydrolase family 16 protein [Daedaleopsis nitida]